MLTSRTTALHRLSPHSEKEEEEKKNSDLSRIDGAAFKTDPLLGSGSALPLDPTLFSLSLQPSSPPTPSPLNPMQDTNVVCARQVVLNCQCVCVCVNGSPSVTAAAGTERQPPPLHSVVGPPCSPLLIFADGHKEWGGGGPHYKLLKGQGQDPALKGSVEPQSCRLHPLSSGHGFGFLIHTLKSANRQTVGT